MAATRAVAALLVVVATMLAAVLRAGAVLAATGAPGAIVVALAMAIADPFEAAATLRTAPVRIEPHEDVVDAAFHFAALAGAADRALGAFVIAAAIGADRAVLRFTADQTVATVELWRPVASGRGHVQQAAFLANGNAAFFSVDADVVTAGQSAALAWHAAAFMAELTVTAIRVVTALGADQLVTDTAAYQGQYADDDIWLAVAIDARRAVVALVRFAALVAVDAGDGRIGGRSRDAAVLIFRTNGDASIHAHVAEFARFVTEQRLARSGGTAASAGVAIFVPAAFLADAIAAEETGGTVGRAGAAIGWVLLEVDAFAVAAGQALGTVWKARATEPRSDADPVTALFGLGIAASVAASEFGFGAAGSRRLVALARRAAGDPAATVVLEWTTASIAGEACLLTSALDIAFPALGTVG